MCFYLQQEQIWLSMQISKQNTTESNQDSTNNWITHIHDDEKCHCNIDIGERMHPMRQYHFVVNVFRLSCRPRDIAEEFIDGHFPSQLITTRGGKYCYGDQKLISWQSIHITSIKNFYWEFDFFCFTSVTQTISL